MANALASAERTNVPVVTDVNVAVVPNVPFVIVEVFVTTVFAELVTVKTTALRDVVFCTNAFVGAVTAKLPRVNAIVAELARKVPRMDVVAVAVALNVPRRREATFDEDFAVARTTALVGVFRVNVLRVTVVTDAERCVVTLTMVNVGTLRVTAATV
jgi:hypothetical protein